MSTETIVFVNQTHGKAPNRRRRACGLCSTQKKKCVIVSQSPPLCEYCKKKDLKECPPPFSRKGVVAGYLALTGQIEEKVEISAAPHREATANGCSPDRPEPIPSSLVPSEIAQQITHGHTSANAIPRQQDDSNTKSQIDRFPDFQNVRESPGPSFDISAGNAVQLYSVSSVDSQPLLPSVQGSFRLDTWNPSVSESDSRPWSDAPEQDFAIDLAPQMVSKNAPSDYLGDDLAPALCRLYEPYNGVRSTFPELATSTHTSQFHDVLYTVSPELLDYPLLPFFNTIESDDTLNAQAPFLTGSACNLQPFGSDDSFEELVKQLQSIQWFPD